MPKRQKTPVREMLPARFVTFIREVAAMIEQGDERVKMESDDLIQIDGHQAFGGLFNVAKGLFGFEYLVNDFDEDGFSITWCFHLDKQQVLDVATERLTHIGMWRCEGRDCGRRFPTIDWYCGECDLPP